MDSRSLQPGDRILLAYDFKGGTIPPDRIVTITQVDDEGFLYRIEHVWVTLGGGSFIPVRDARRYGLTIRGGRKLSHDSFKDNCRIRSKRRD